MRVWWVSWQEQRRLRLRLVVPHLELADDAELDAAFEGYLHRYEAGWRAFEDVAPALAALDVAGLRMGVLTNGAIAQQHAKLAALGLAGRFEFVLTSEDVGTGKPDPIAFLTECDRFGLPAGEVVHVGDIPDLDLTGARAAGLHAVLIDRADRYGLGDSLRPFGDLPGWITALASTGPSPRGSGVHS